MANKKASRLRGPNHLWTKADIQKVCKLWSTKTTQQIADDLKVEVYQVQSLATLIRKTGYPLPRKMVKGRLRTLVEEALSELA